MNEIPISALLDGLAELRASLDARRLTYEAEQAAILAPVQGQLDTLKLHYEQDIAWVATAAAEQEAAIKAAVLTHGQSVRGTRLLAVFMKGRVVWDTKQLDGYAVAHPEIAAFRSVNAPTVSIRSI